jgi:hypothetical protein
MSIPLWRFDIDRRAAGGISIVAIETRRRAGLKRSTA